MCEPRVRGVVFFWGGAAKRAKELHLAFFISAWFPHANHVQHTNYSQPQGEMIFVMKDCAAASWSLLLLQ